MGPIPKRFWWLKRFLILCAVLYHSFPPSDTEPRPPGSGTSQRSMLSDGRDGRRSLASDTESLKPFPEVN